MNRFDELMKSASLVGILNSKGREVLISLATLTVENSVTSDSQKLAVEIFKIFNNKPWLHGAMALFFCLDMILQNNPAIENDIEIQDMIKDLEERMKVKYK
jgi:hypothetical protein